MTNPQGENDMPPVFYRGEARTGRRKSERVEVIIKGEIPAPPRRWWESWIFRIAFTLALVWALAAVFQ